MLPGEATDVEEGWVRLVLVMVGWGQEIEPQPHGL